MLICAAKELGELNPSLYKSTSMDSQDFSPTTEEFAGKVYIKVITTSCNALVSSGGCTGLVHLQLIS
jgi:hypothetical protein